MSSARRFSIAVSAGTEARLASAAAFIGRVAPGHRVLIVGATRGAADELARRVAAASPATLDLAMCYGTLKQAGGYIGVESAEGKGTTFWIYLPLLKGKVTEVEEEGVARAERREGTARVLLVEDEPAVADLTRRALEFGGYSVLVAHSGTEALAVLAGLREPVDLLLTDVMMPDMRGTMLATRVRVLYPELPVMFVSGYPGPLEEEFRIARLLAKPFSPGELLKQVGKRSSRGSKGRRASAARAPEAGTRHGRLVYLWCAAARSGPGMAISAGSFVRCAATMASAFAMVAASPRRYTRFASIRSFWLSGVESGPS